MRNNKIKGEFGSYISRSQTFINKIELGIAKVQDDPDKLFSVCNFKFKRTLELIQAMYSDGYEKNVIQEEYSKLMDFFLGYSSHILESGYSSIVRIISFGILLDENSETMSKIVKTISNSKKSDKFICYMLNYFDSSIEFESKAYEFSEYYKSIYELNSSSEAASYLKSKWYKNQEDEPWYDIHLHKHENLYSGYWAWDVAAIVKIKGIDPNPLEGVDYFPYDALVW